MKGENVTGSINIMSIFTKAIGAQVKVGLSEAATTAEQTSEMDLAQWPLVLDKRMDS